MPIAEDSAGGSPVPIPTNLTTNLTGEATGSGTLDYTTGDIDIVVTVVDNGHNHILSNITDVQVNNAISGQILVYNGTVWANATNTSGITALVQDTSPQLGGNLDLNNRNITGTGNIAITGTIDGRDVSADGTKLDGIESGATADQTAAQIKTAYESNANTNNFADADVSKLSGIEPGATADQTAAQIKTAYESNSNTNAFTDADHTKLDGIETSADVTDTTNVVASLTAGTNVTIAADGTISATGGTSGIAHVVDDTTPELGGNLSLNSHDITGTGNLNFTGSVTLSGTVDGRDVAADGTKLDGIEAGANITDTANVTAAGALMDSEVTNLAQVKAFDSSDYATAAQGTTADAALPTTGGTMTGDLLFNDSVKAKYGTSSDLQIFHDGSDSYITESGTGILFLRSNQLKIQSDDGLETYGVFTDNGSVQLYHNNVERLETNSVGVSVTGVLDIFDNNSDISPDGSGSGQLKIDGNGYRAAIALDADGVNLYSTSASRPLIFGVNETEVARVTSTGIGVGTSSPSYKIDVRGDSNTNVGIQVKASGTGDVDAELRLDAADTGESLVRYARDGTTRAVSEYTNSNEWNFTTYNNDKIDFQPNSTNAFRITDTNVYSYKTFNAQDDIKLPDNSQIKIGTGDDLLMYQDGTASIIKHNTTGQLFFMGDDIRFVNQANNNAIMYLIGDVVKFYGNSTRPDNTYSQFGASNDLQIYHDGSNSYVRDVGTGDLYIDTNSGIHLYANGSENMLYAVPNAGVQIFYNNVKKLETTSTGIDVTGNIDISGAGTRRIDISNTTLADTGEMATLQWDNNANLTIQGRTSAGGFAANWYSIQTSDTDGRADAHIFYTDASTERMRINSTGVGIGTTSPAHELHIESTSPTIRLVDSDGSNTLDITQSGSASYLTFDNNMRFRNASNVEKLRIDSGGIDVTGDLLVSSTIEVGSLTPNQDGAIEVGVIALGTPAISSTTDSTSLRNHIIFDNPNGAVGKINTLNSSTSYLTSSDYRLKTDVQEMTGSIDRVKALRPVNFEWVVDGTRVDGFLAHEAQEVVPEAVDGEKDAMRDQEYVVSEATGDIYTPAVKATYETIQVELTPAVEATYDDEGNELTPAVDATYEEQQQELTPAIDEVIHSSDVVEPDELEEGQRWRETTEKVMATRQVPDYQGIDQSKIVPLLTSALQDAIAKIEALETRLTALES